MIYAIIIFLMFTVLCLKHLAKGEATQAAIFGAAAGFALAAIVMSLMLDIAFSHWSSRQAEIEKKWAKGIDNKT